MDLNAIPGEEPLCVAPTNTGKDNNTTTLRVKGKAFHGRSSSSCAAELMKTQKRNAKLTRAAQCTQTQRTQRIARTAQAHHFAEGSL